MAGSGWISSNIDVVRNVFKTMRGDIIPMIAPHYVFSYLSTETEFLDDISVSLDIDFLEIIKNTTSLTDQFQKRKTCYMVFLVVLQVLGKVSDTVGK